MLWLSYLRKLCLKIFKRFFHQCFLLKILHFYILHVALWFTFNWLLYKVSPFEGIDACICQTVFWKECFLIGWILFLPLPKIDWLYIFTVFWDSLFYCIYLWLDNCSISVDLNQYITGIFFPFQNYFLLYSLCMSI